MHGLITRGDDHHLAASNTNPRAPGGDEDRARFEEECEPAVLDGVVFSSPHKVDRGTFPLHDEIFVEPES